jgi:hypothetical protein
MYCVHKVQMSLPGRCVSGGTLVQNYDVTNVVPIQKDHQLLLLLKRRPHFQTHKWSWNKQEFGHGSQLDLKPRVTVLATASSNLLDWTGLVIGCPVIGVTSF